MEIKSLNILVTGGCGFIGSIFCNYISNYVNKLVILDKISNVSNVKNIKNILDCNNVFLIKENMLSHNFLETFSKYEINYIIHFAAQTHVDNSYKNFKDFIDDNIVATQLLLDAITKYEKKIQLLHFSTDEVYGPSINNVKFDENSNFNPTNPYSASKACCEMIINTYKYSYNLPIIITRCNNVYGKFQFGEKVIPCFITNAIKDGYLPIQGDGSKIRDFIHINDVIDAIIIIIEKGTIGEIYNIGNNNPIEIIDLANMIIYMVGSGKIKYIEDRPFNDNRYYVNTDKLEKLGWQCKTNFIKGITEVIEWIKSNPNYWNNE